MHGRHASLLLILGLAGCDQPQHTTQSTPTYLYQCESGRIVQASYSSADTVILEYEGQTLHMNHAISASGARYVGGGLEWWSKGSGPGSEGNLFRQENSDNATGQALELCKEVSTK